MTGVLDHGFVLLDDSMANDLSVVNSARISVKKRSTYELAPVSESITQCSCPGGPETHGYSLGCYRLRKEDIGLIQFLMREKHGTPFEHNAFRFHVKTPIFVAREWFRHRIGSFNEMSGRYTEYEKEFYIPEAQHVRSQVGKPGAYSFTALPKELAGYVRKDLLTTQEEAWKDYQWALAAGLAKEQARFFLPVTLYTQFYWTVNARSLMNFLGLRNEEHAMWEIRQFAIAVEEIFASHMPVTYQAWLDNDRIAP